MRVLDLGCGEGRNAITAAQWGAVVTAVDQDEARLDAAKEAAARAGVEIEFWPADLTAAWPPFGEFDIVLLFNYLDRARMDDIRSTVASGGVLLMETYLKWQRALGWGPSSDDHLLLPGELVTLVAPLEAVHGREVFEPVENNRIRAVASVVAQKR